MGHSRDEGQSHIAGLGYTDLLGDDDRAEAAGGGTPEDVFGHLPTPTEVRRTPTYEDEIPVWRDLGFPGWEVGTEVLEALGKERGGRAGWGHA